MKSALFAFFVGASSTLMLRVHPAAISGWGHLLRTLQGWAVAAFLIALTLEWARRRVGASRESTATQVSAALLAWVALAMLLWTIVRASQGGAIMTVLGGVLAPVMVVMALELSTLTPLAVTATLLFAASLFSAKPALRPQIIRTHGPASGGETARPSKRPQSA